MHDAIGNSDVKEGNEGIVKGGTFLFRVRLPEKKKAKPRVGRDCKINCVIDNRLIYYF